MCLCADIVVDSAVVCAYADSAFLSYHSWISHLSDSATVAAYADSAYLAYHAWIAHFADSATNCVYCDTAIYALSAGGSGGASYWDSTAGVIHPNDTTNRIAIGSDRIEGGEWLKIGGSYASYGETSNTPNTAYNGALCYFNTAKAAFRAGWNSYGYYFADAQVGTYSAGFNDLSLAQGTSSFAANNGTTAAGATGYQAAAFNKGTANANYTFAIGLDAVANGLASLAGGYNTNAASYVQVSFGRYNVAGGTAGSWVSTDQGFVYGNGTVGNLNNAFTVLKNGTTYIGDASSTTDPIMIVSTTDSIITVNGLSVYMGLLQLDSLQRFTPTTGVSGRGWISIYNGLTGTTAEWADFFYADDGTVTLIQNSANVVNTDTDGKVCIIDDGSGIAILNRLAGAAKGYKIRLEY